MTYTLWHCGVLIGTTDFEDADRDGPNRGARRHLAGAFHPTDYGRELLPRLCGMITAAADLKEELVLRGLNVDDAPPEVIEHLFETTAAGAHVVDIGRVLSDVELRSPSGATLEVASMDSSSLPSSRRSPAGSVATMGRSSRCHPMFRNSWYRRPSRTDVLGRRRRCAMSE